jgi:segregation and condensation protein B
MASKKDGKKPENENQNIVSLVEDPFGLNTLEIADAQNDAGELDLDECDDECDDEGDFEEVALDESALENLEKKISEAAADHVEEAEEKLVEGLSEEAAAKELARQIAEDEALEKELAAEAEQAEKLDPELQAALPNSEALDLNEVQSCVEALLFMADKPMSVEKLRELLGPNFTHGVFQEAITELMDRYKGTHHGIELVKVAGGYQFRTKPGRAALARKLAKIQSQRLSGGAMETLAIIAYKQPALKDDIDKIRGVDSSHFIRGLLDKKLIRISGRSELPGRPMEYSTSPEFLEVFGLPDLQAMPPLKELENMIPASQAKNEEDPRVKRLRELVGEMNMDTSITLAYDPKEDEKLLQEIRERVSSIPMTTPYLAAQAQAEADQKAADKASAKAEAESDLVKQAELLAAQSIAETIAVASEAASETTV